MAGEKGSVLNENRGGCHAGLRDVSGNLLNLSELSKFANEGDRGSEDERTDWTTILWPIVR
jgi:hypothetical protein